MPSKRSLCRAIVHFVNIIHTIVRSVFIIKVDIYASLFYKHNPIIATLLDANDILYLQDIDRCCKSWRQKHSPLDYSGFTIHQVQNLCSEIEEILNRSLVLQEINKIKMSPLYFEYDDESE